MRLILVHNGRRRLRRFVVVVATASVRVARGRMNRRRRVNSSTTSFAADALDASVLLFFGLLLGLAHWWQPLVDQVKALRLLERNVPLLVGQRFAAEYFFGYQSSLRIQ